MSKDRDGAPAWAERVTYQGVPMWRDTRSGARATDWRQLVNLRTRKAEHLKTETRGDGVGKR